jgi:DNA-binding CsgD family transcriptional regulator
MGRLPTTGRRYQLSALSDMHKEIARRLVLGEKRYEIAKALGVSRETISIVKGSSIAQDYMRTLERERDNNAVDIGQQLVALCPAAMCVLENAVNGTLDGTDRDLRVKAAESILDRTGYAKQNRVDARVLHANVVTGEEITDIKRRAIDTAREMGMLGLIDAMKDKD